MLNADRYSRFLKAVPAMHAAQTTASTNPATGRRTREPIATTSSAISPASGRYIRLSAPTSVATGTKLDEGASVMKNQAAGNANFGDRANVSTVAVRSAPTISAYGRTSPTDSSRGSPYASTSDRGHDASWR